MKNRDYWKKRFDINQQNLLKPSDKYMIELERAFKGALNDIEKETAVWYQRFADNNGITDMSEARRLLTSSELKELKWNVNEYIKYGKENGITADWSKELENASARYHISRLQALELQTRQQIETLYNTYFDSTDGLLRNTYKNSYYRTGYETALGTGIGTSFSKIDERKLQRVMSKPWSADGTNFSEKIWNDRTKLVNTLHNELTRGIISGKKPDEIIKNISKSMSTSYNNAKRLVMTESAFFSSAGQLDAYKELNVHKYEILGTFDTRFCSLCEEFDGKVFELKDFQAGVTAPPFHPNCRCTTIPYFDDEFTAGEQRAARDKNGKTVYVDSKMSYEDWKEKFVKDSKSGILNSRWNGLGYSSNYTKKEAIGRLKQQYGIVLKDSRKYPISEMLLNDCVGWLDSFNTHYNAFMNKNPCKIPTIAVYPPSKMKNAVGYYSYYRDTSKVAELALNGQYHSSIEIFENYVKQCVQINWYPANATIHKTFIHEYGHHVSNSMRWISGDKEWQSKFINDCIKDYNINIGGNIKGFSECSKLVSDYGASSESELFAEAFAEYFGGDNPREFASIFGKKLDNILKGVK